jgi:hypothetical protein
MSNTDVTSSLSRSRFRVMLWLDLLSEDAKSEAQMAMDALMQVATHEIEQAYRDGMNHRSSAVQSQKMKREALASTNGARE